MANKNSSQIKSLTTYSIDNPSQVKQMAKVLTEYIVKNNLSVRILDKDYVMVEGWQFAGSLMGLFPRVAEVQNIGQGKWTAKAEIVSKDGKVITTGYALCSKEEMKKKSFDEYAILSMAQTRAIGKAYRNLIGWVIKLAGYEPTPAEEMKEKPIDIPVKENKADNLYASEAEKEKILLLAKELKLTGKIDKAIEDMTGLKVDWKNMTKTQASKIIFELMAKRVQK